LSIVADGCEDGCTIATGAFGKVCCWVSGAPQAASTIAKPMGQTLMIDLV
jgi:hypothetical protein